MTNRERNALLARHRDAREQYERNLDAHAAALDSPGEIGIDESSEVFADTPAYREARAAYAELVALEKEYFENLPRPVMAPCPFCGQPLHRSFDPFGLDGFWWRSDAQPEEPEPCLHFCLLLGAVKLDGPASPTDFAVHPGPARPFVVPRLLELPGMTAVISSLPIEGGVAYPIAYFAPRRPPVQALAAGWGRTNFVYTTQLGEHAWRGADGEVQDFALAPWITGGRVRWCAPDGDRTVLAESGICPYLTDPG
jgi:hypothetical protein